MKKLAIAAAIVLVLLAATPWVLGSMARQRIAAGIERLDAEAQIDAAVLASEGGWTSSTTTIAIELPLAARPDDVAPEVAEMLALFDEPVQLVVGMQHGPVLADDGLSLGLAASTIRLDPATPGYQELLAELGIPYLFEIRSRTSFDGQSEFVSEVPSFEYADGEVTVAFSGSQSAGSYDAALRHVVARGEAASLRIAAGDGVFEMQDIRFDTDSTRHSDVLRVGHAEASVARIRATGPGEQFEIDDFGVRFDIAVEDGGEHATLTAEYRVARLDDGTDLDVAGLEVVATAHRVDIEALTAYYLAAQQAGISDDPTAPLSLELEDAIYALLAASPVVDVAPLRFSYNGEPLDASLRLTVDGASLPQRTGFTVLALAFDGVVSLDASLELSEALANVIAARGMAFQIRRGAAQDGLFMTDDEIETIATTQAAIAIAGLAAQDMLVATPEGYATTLRFAGGELTVNGNAIPLGLP
ncbi:MAG TPA: DUF945 family protein, partial [Gammaproteobacteria bacterium]|nr:DUF945 family protein [Gammaproteobacteria bacterium]